MHKTPFLRITLTCIIGIFLYDYGVGNFKIFSILGIAAGMCMICFKFYAKFKLHAIQWFGYSSILFLLCFGYCIGQLQDIQFDQAFLGNQNLNLTEEQVYRGTITEKRSGAFGTRYVINVQEVEPLQQEITGKILCVSSQDSFKINDYVQFETSLQSIVQHKKQIGFNYEQFLHRRGIYYRCKANQISCIKASNSLRIRSLAYLKSKLQALKLSDSVMGLMQSLVLGDQSNIAELKTTFRRIGASHILAISGLHVGIVSGLIFMLLSKLPGPMRYVQIPLVIAGTWCYCAITGFAPSTVRAATMLSFFMLGKLSNKQGSAYNFCFLAAFCMLILQPKLIYEIGFQFSFLAVISILMLFEPLNKTLVLRGWKEKVWQLCVLSFCAQILLMPLSVYYFHEFPLMFLPASLLAVPMTGFMIVGTISLMSIQCLVPSFNHLDIVFDWIVSRFIQIMEYLAAIEGTIIQQIYPKPIELLLYYLAIFGICRFFLNKSKSGLGIFTLGFASLLAVQSYISMDINSNKLVLYPNRYNLSMDLMSGGKAISYRQKERQNNFDKQQQKEAHDAFQIQEKHLQLLPKTGNFSFKINQFEILVIQDDDTDNIAWSAIDLCIVRNPEFPCEALPQNGRILSFHPLECPNIKTEIIQKNSLIINLK